MQIIVVSFILQLGYKQIIDKMKPSNNPPSEFRTELFWGKEEAIILTKHPFDTPVNKQKCKLINDYETQIIRIGKM